jgi:hypothetical protein
MAYSKRSYKPKAKKATTWRKYAGKALTAGGKQGIKALKMALGLNTESKNYDVTSTSALSLTMAGYVSPMGALAQGLTNNTREGNSIRCTHWNLRIKLDKPALQSVDSAVRIICFRQDQCATLTTGADLLQSPTLLYSPYNTDLQGVKVLYDKVFELHSDFAGDLRTIYKNIHIKFGYDDGHSVWLDSDTTGNTASLQKGYVVMMAMTDTVAGAAANITYYSRLNFVDN